MILPVSYLQFRIIIHIFIGLVFLIELLKPSIPRYLYNFFKSNKDILFGIYYMYLAFEIYINTDFKQGSQNIVE